MALSQMAKDGDKEMWQWRPENALGPERTEAVPCDGAITKPKGASP